MAESAVQKAERNDFSEVRWLLHLFLWMFNVWFRLQTLPGPASQNHHCPVSLFIVHPWIIFSHFLVYSLIYLNFRMLILYHGSTLFEHLRVWFCCLCFIDWLPPHSSEGLIKYNWRVKLLKLLCSVFWGISVVIKQSLEYDYVKYWVALSDSGIHLLRLAASFLKKKKN